jgi:hypothetical protein
MRYNINWNMLHSLRDNLHSEWRIPLPLGDCTAALSGHYGNAGAAADDGSHPCSPQSWEVKGQGIRWSENIFTYMGGHDTHQFTFTLI